MAIPNFPAAPENGASYVENGITYIWNSNGSNVGYWEATTSSGSSVTVGENAPSSPSNGDLWWDSSDDGGRLYVWYVDANSSQWVESSPAGSETSDGGGIEEAPTDGQQYARQNEAWSVVQAGDNNTTINYSGAAAWGLIDGPTGNLLGGSNCSVVRNSTGFYTVTFNTAMPPGYAVVASAAAGAQQLNVVTSAQAVNGFEIKVSSNTQDVAAEPIYVNFTVNALNALPPRGGTGTDAWGTVDGATGATLSSFNSSSSKISTGYFQVTFDTPMPDANYSVVADQFGSVTRFVRVQDRETTGFKVAVLATDTGNPVDSNGFSFQVNATNATLPETITEDQIAALIQNPVLSAWGSINADGTVNGSFNLKPAPISRPGSGTFELEFVTPMPNDDYSVTIGSASLNAIVENKTSTGFQVTTHDGSNNNSWLDFDFQVVSEARNGTLGGGADAWGSFSGAAGTPDADRLANGFGVQGVVRDQAGQYTVTLANNMPNLNYCVVTDSSTTNTFASFTDVSKTINSFQIVVRDNTGTRVDSDNLHFALFATDGNAGGFWVKTDDELAPLSATDSVSIGGGDITLNADGRAEFAKTIKVANPSGGTETGAALYTNGTIENTVTTDADLLYQGWKKDNTPAKITFKGDGSATFASTVQLGGARGVDAVGASLEPFGGVRAARPSNQANPGNASVWEGWLGTDVTSLIRADGSAVFDGAVIVNGTRPVIAQGDNLVIETGAEPIDVKDRIQNLLSRLDAIEANEVVDDATDTSLLQLVAAAAARLDALEATNASLEARITALEGGN